MFHAEIRSGTQVVREFNLDERALWVRYLAPLLEGRDFVREGHEWTPNKTRITILDGPELLTHQISMGRGWPNAQRACADVTEAVMARARELRNETANTTTSAARTASDFDSGTRTLRERLIGRLGAGPVGAAQIEALALSVMPDADPAVRAGACERAVWELLVAGEAQLAESDR